MRRPSLDTIMRYWPVVVGAIILSNVLLAIEDAQGHNKYLVLVPIAAIVVLCSQQGYYLGKRRGYEKLKQEILFDLPTTVPCVGGPMDGQQIPKPQVSHAVEETISVEVRGFPEGRYEFHDDQLFWVEE